MNLFLLTAPYQILSALELIKVQSMGNNHLIIIDTGHFTEKQFLSVINSKFWQTVKFYNFKYKLKNYDFGENRPRNIKERVLEIYLVFDQLVKRQKAELIAKFTPSLKSLILGNYRSNYDCHMRHIANRLSYNEIFLLDVGTDTYRINEDRYIDINEIPDNEGGEKHRNFKSWIKSRFIEWDTHGADSVTFFSAYDLGVVPNDKLIRNKYNFLRSIVADNKPTEDYLFVGQPLVDQGYVTNTTFKQLMIRIKSYFKDTNLIYVAHPRESDSQLNLILDLGIEIKMFEAPFEYEIPFSGYRPMGIASFFSSVLENSTMIFDESITILAFRLPESLLLKQKQEIKKIYRSFSKNNENITVIEDY